MVILKGLSVLLVTGTVLGTTQVPADPVLRARAQRAQAQGISEDDLPPLPKGVTEPPPLPPPELHVKDARRASRGKASKGNKPGKTATAKGKVPAKPKGRKGTKKPKA